MIGSRQGDLSSSSTGVTGRERLIPQDASSTRSFGGGQGSGGNSTGMLGETPNSFGETSTRVLDDARWGSMVAAPVIGSDYRANHVTGTTHPPQVQPQPLPRPPQLRPEEQLRSPDESSAEPMVDARTSSFGDAPLSGSGLLAAPTRREEEQAPCPGLRSHRSPQLGAFAALEVTPPTMLARQPLEVPCIGRSTSLAAGEAGVPSPPLNLSAAAAAAGAREGREGPPHALRDSRTRDGLEVTATSRFGGAGDAPASPSPPPPPPPPPSTASSATTCQAPGVPPPALQSRSGSHNASSGSQRIVSPPPLLEGRNAEGEQGRRAPATGGTVSTEHGSRSPVGGDGVGGWGVTCVAVAGGGGSDADCEVSRGVRPRGYCGRTRPGPLYCVLLLSACESL